MRVFLSHASESKPLVRTIAAHFPPHVEVWLDVNELSTGAPLPENIERAIDYECDYVIVFVEANALASDWVRREVGMALRRERDLKRPFLLPVLLEPLADQLPRLGELGERIHFDATDSTPAGLQRAGELLCGELFALASRLIEGLRSTGRHQMLAEFARDLNAFKQAAFLWIGELANPLAVLSANLPAFEKLRDAIADYNRVADPFIAGLNVTASASRRHRQLPRTDAGLSRPDRICRERRLPRCPVQAERSARDDPRAGRHGRRRRCPNGDSGSTPRRVARPRSRCLADPDARLDTGHRRTRA